MENFELQEKLRAFAAGELSPDEIDALRREAARSPEVLDELRFSKKLTQALQHKDLLEVNGIIGGIIALEGLPPTASEAGKGNLNWGGWLISVLLLIGLAGSVFWVGSRLDWWQSRTERLAEQWLKPMENLLFTEQSGMSVDDLRLGMEAYDQGDYKTAIQHLEKYFNRTKDANAGLFLGVSYLFNKQIREALTVLQNIAPQLEAPAQEAAKWYMALAHMKNNDRERAIEVLKTISADNWYGTSAKEALERLE